MVERFWIAQARLITPQGICEGAVQVVGGRIARMAQAAPRRADAIDLKGAFLAPGFIDLHVWGQPEKVAREAVRAGATAFLATLGPQRQEDLEKQLRELPREGFGARCLGVHLEGPFLNPERAGALPKRWMRSPGVKELRALEAASGGRLRLITLAPELPGAEAAIRWCARRGIVVSLGHSQASAICGFRAVEAGARAVTHLFNGMPAFHHRKPSVLDVGLVDPRLTVMVIADGVHTSPTALRWVIGSRPTGSVALVTDSIRLKPGHAQARSGAYYLPSVGRRTGGVLAGSSLTMIGAVERAIRLGGATLEAAVAMATEVPARLLGLERQMGVLAAGRRADLVAFDRHYRVRRTFVSGQTVFSRSL